MMRKYTSLILVIIILFASNGYYMYFKYLQNNIQQEIQHEIRNGLDESKLSLIIVSLNDTSEIYWTEKDKEFRYKGTMYDIVKTEIKGQKKYYYCINDIEEQQLFVRLLKINRKDKTLLRLRKSLNYKYFPQRNYLRINDISLNIYFIENAQFYKSKIIDVISPPPKMNSLS